MGKGVETVCNHAQEAAFARALDALEGNETDDRGQRGSVEESLHLAKLLGASDERLFMW